MDNFNEFNISHEILLSLDKLGYKKPTEVQEKVIPLIIQNKDIIVQSQTGSGKTGSFAIPICENIEIENNIPQALVITPTRELCVQIKDDICNIGRFKKVRCAAVFGKQTFSSQVDELKQRVHAIVGTPGRILDHISRNTIKLQGIRYLVIDEADEMLNMGFIDQVKEIIKKLPEDRINMLFSATMPEKINTLSSEYMNKPVLVKIKAEISIDEKIEDYYYIVEGKNKFQLLENVIYKEMPERCIIFCNTRNNVDMVFDMMKNQGLPCASIHGGMLQNDRLDVIGKFSRGQFVFLVATDVAARGIDIINIDYVINYDMPFEKENYVHRIGRTGRAGNYGKAISFLTPSQIRFLNEIESYINRNIKQREYFEIEDIQDRKKLFYEKVKNLNKFNKDKAFEINRSITKIYINAGKKKKIRNIDIAGTISSIDGVVSEDIGIIDIHDNFSYVDILNDKASLIIDALKKKTMKGKKIKCEKAEK